MLSIQLTGSGWDDDSNITFSSLYQIWKTENIHENVMEVEIFDRKIQDIISINVGYEDMKKLRDFLNNSINYIEGVSK